jgi:hypothetical protein
MLGMLSRLRRLTDSVITNPFLMWAGFAALMAAFIVGTVGWYGDFFEQLRIPLWASVCPGLTPACSRAGPVLHPPGPTAVLGLVLLFTCGPAEVGRSAARAGFFALSDFVDYASIAPQRFGGYGYYPPLPPVNGNYFGLVPAMQIHALIMTWAVAGGQALRAIRGRRDARRA